MDPPKFKDGHIFFSTLENEAWGKDLLNIKDGKKPQRGTLQTTMAEAADTMKNTCMTKIKMEYIMEHGKKVGV